MHQSLKTTVTAALLTLSHESLTERAHEHYPQPLGRIQPAEKQSSPDAVQVLLASFNPHAQDGNPKSSGRAQSDGKQGPSEAERYQQYRPKVDLAEKAYSNRSEAALWARLRAAILVNSTADGGASAATFIKDFRKEITKVIMDGDSPSKEGLVALQKRYDEAFWKKLGITKPAAGASISISGSTGDLTLVVTDKDGKQLSATRDVEALKLHGAASFCSGAVTRMEKKSPEALIVSWGQLDAQLSQAIERAERK